jgi:serine protease
VEAHLRTRLLSLFALSIALVACPTVENRSGSISGIIRMTPKRTGQSVQATEVTGGLQPSSLTVAPMTGSSLTATQFTNIIPGRVIVKFKSGLRVQSVGPLSARLAGRLVKLEPQRTLGLAGVQLMRATGVDAKGTLELAAQLAARSDVEYAEPDRRIHALLTPNDTQYGQQWALGSSALGRLNMPSAWSVTTGSSLTGPNPVVAVVDSGVMLAHPDLASKILPGYDFISDPSTAADGDGRDANPDDPGDDELSYHGTHVSGIAAAIGNNRLGMAGVSWGARILPARILGVGGGTVSDMIDAVLWAAGIDSTSVPPAYPHNPNKADVINLSVGGAGTCSNAEQDAFNQVIATGTAVVVAAGNEIPGVGVVDAWTTDPASCAGLIVVGAVGRDGTRASYSNYGSRVSIMAPGGDKTSGGGILSTVKNSAGKAAYDYKIGTSMATPHVAGVIALMRSLRPKLTPGQIEALLDTEADAVNCSGKIGCGVGLLDAGAIMRYLKATSSVPKPDFALLPDHSVLTATRGTSTISVNIRAAAFNGLTGPIALSVQASGGITAQLSASSITPGSDESTITFDTGEAASGTYPVRVTGSAAGGVSRTIQLLMPIPGTLVNACYLTTNKTCDTQKSASIKLELNNTVTVAPYVIDQLQPGAYVIQAWKDSNNNDRLDTGDLYGESRTGVSPPSANIDVTVSSQP